MKVLGLKIGSHDPGAALVAQDGGSVRVMAIAEERLSRVKHAPHAFPSLSIDYVLSGLNVRPEEIDLVVYDSALGDVQFADQEKEISWIRERMGAGFSSTRFVGANHHDAHAATAFFCSPYDEAAVLVYDGSGGVGPSTLGVDAMETETFYRGKGNTLTVIHKTLHACPPQGGFPFSVGIGRLYANLSQNYIGLGPHNEGKMMGLAAYGDDSLLRQFPYERWVTSYNGELICNSRIRYPGRSAAAFIKRSGGVGTFVRDVRNGLMSRSRKLYARLVTKVSSFAAKTAYPSVLEPITLPRPFRDTVNDTLPDHYYSSVAYAAQHIFERFAIEAGRYLRAVTDSDTICVAGGCALNIDANRNFLTKVGFKNIFVQPASSDCGIALGCALWGLHVVLGAPRGWVMRSASLGRRYPDGEVREALERHKAAIEWQIVADAPKEAARLVSEGNIIGWFQGGAEYGPRALGNRSIVCDARNPDMKDILNKRVKHREMWRPFAASVLLERMPEWFDLSTESPFMLLTGVVLEEKRAAVPSIVHVDGTCRLQSLTEDANGPYWRLVREFETLTGVPLVLNTSFNLGGDPIVETPHDAIDTFLRTDMDYLVLENAVIRKRQDIEA